MTFTQEELNLLGADSIQRVYGSVSECKVVRGRMDWSESKPVYSESLPEGSRFKSVKRFDCETYAVGSSDYKGDYSKIEYKTLEELTKELESARQKQTQQAQQSSVANRTQQGEPICYVLFGRVLQTWDDVYNAEDFDGVSHKNCYSLQDVHRHVSNYQQAVEDGYFGEDECE